MPPGKPHQHLSLLSIVRARWPSRSREPSVLRRTPLHLHANRPVHPVPRRGRAAQPQPPSRVTLPSKFESIFVSSCTVRHTHSTGKPVLIQTRPLCERLPAPIKTCSRPSWLP